MTMHCAWLCNCNCNKANAKKRKHLQLRDLNLLHRERNHFETSALASKIKIAHTLVNRT